MSVPRLVIATVAVGTLLAMVGWSVGSGQVEGPARVEAASEFRVTHAGDGRVRWTLLDGTVAGGPAMVSDGVMQADRGDPVSVSLQAGLKSGQHVEANTQVASVTTTRQGEDVSALLAQTQTLDAQLALLQAGGRPESIALARQGVDVAQASLEQAQADLVHVQELLDADAIGSWSVEQAQRDVVLRQAQIKQERARLEQSRVPARAEEVAELRARQAEVQARLDAAQSRVHGQDLRTPIAGTVALSAGDTIVSVIGDQVPVLQLAVDESARARVSVGDPVSFVPTANSSHAVRGSVLSVGDTAGTLGGQPVVWVVAALDQPLAVGATGRARVLGGGGPTLLWGGK